MAQTIVTPIQVNDKVLVNPVHSSEYIEYIISSIEPDKIGIKHNDGNDSTILYLISNTASDSVEYPWIIANSVNRHNFQFINGSIPTIICPYEPDQQESIPEPEEIMDEIIKNLKIGNFEELQRIIPDQYKFIGSLKPPKYDMYQEYQSLFELDINVIPILDLFDRSDFIEYTGRFLSIPDEITPSQVGISIILSIAVMTKNYKVIQWLNEHHPSYEPAEYLIFTIITTQDQTALDWISQNNIKINFSNNESYESFTDTLNEAFHDNNVDQLNFIYDNVEKFGISIEDIIEQFHSYIDPDTMDEDVEYDVMDWAISKMIFPPVYEGGYSVIPFILSNRVDILEKLLPYMQPNNRAWEDLISAVIDMNQEESAKPIAEWLIYHEIYPSDDQITVMMGYPNLTDIFKIVYSNKGYHLSKLDPEVDVGSNIIDSDFQQTLSDEAVGYARLDLVDWINKVQFSRLTKAVTNR